ncbi:hypothetical protein CB1_000606010 [Camelus ferus]|nr:hypothetical protein CB1_000606010 [Camelus ferus]
MKLLAILVLVAVSTFLVSGQDTTNAPPDTPAATEAPGTTAATSTTSAPTTTAAVETAAAPTVTTAARTTTRFSKTAPSKRFPYGDLDSLCPLSS